MSLANNNNQYMIPKR